DWGRGPAARAVPGSEAAAQALAQLVTEEEDPQVLPGLLRAAGNYRSPAIAAAVEDRLVAGLGYLAQMAAYETLGAQRDAAPFDLLATAAATDGYGGFAQSGALRALAATRRKEALAALVAAAAPGATSNRARPAAVGALGALGKVLDGRGREAAVEALVDGLRDESPRVRQAAVAALKTLEDPRGIPSLLVYRAGRPAQEQVAVDRAVAALRAGSKPRAGEREKDLEELHVELRKLKTAVGRLEARVNKDAGHGKGTGGSGEAPSATGEEGAPGDATGEE
ncbi:MAG: HEAT repeat domain-containing protein, partial [Anaerolineae bacterium]